MRTSTLLLVALSASSTTMAQPTTTSEAPSSQLVKRSTITFGFITQLYCEAPRDQRITYTGPGAKCYNLPSNFSGANGNTFSLGLNSDSNDGCKIQAFTTTDCAGAPGGANGFLADYNGKGCWVPGYLLKSVRVTC
jgi:hypothetical protein